MRIFVPGDGDGEKKHDYTVPFTGAGYVSPLVPAWKSRKVGKSCFLSNSINIVRIFWSAARAEVSVRFNHLDYFSTKITSSGKVEWIGVMFIHVLSIGNSNVRIIYHRRLPNIWISSNRILSFACSLRISFQKYKFHFQQTEHPFDR